MQGLKKAENRTLVVAGIAVIGFWLLVIVRVAWSWGSYVNVSNNIGSSFSPAIAVDSANTVHVAWSDDTINYAGNNEILYKTSSDGGATWTPEQNLSNSASRSDRPAIAAAGPNAVVVAWIDNDKTYARIWNGNIWSLPAQLSTSSEPTQRLSVAINQNGVALVAWSEGSDIEIYGSGGPPSQGYLYSRWDGSTWAAPVAMTGRIVAMRGNLAYLATSQRTLLRSTDGGATWANPVALPASYIVPDDMRIDSRNRLYLAWFSPIDNGVYAGLYDGQAFNAAVEVTAGGDPNPYKQLGLAINASDQLTLIWSKNTMVPYNGYEGAIRRTLQVLTSQSSDGVTWSAPASVVTNSGCFSAVAGSQTGTQFYGAWQSPNCFSGDSPDVYVAFQNGVGTPGQSFSISGNVRDTNNTPIAGVTISGASTGTVLTNSSGIYTVTGLITGTYTLSASKSGYRFSDPLQVAVPPSRIGQDFVGSTFCINNPPTGVNLTITKITDDLQNSVYSPNGSSIGTVDGNDVIVTVRIENCAANAIQGAVTLSRSDRLVSATLDPFSFKEAELSFNSRGMAWDSFGNRSEDGLIAYFSSGGISTPSAPVPFTVHPRPVVLVHGYNDTAASWSTYTNTFLMQGPFAGVDMRRPSGLSIYAPVVRRYRQRPKSVSRNLGFDSALINCRRRLSVWVCGCGCK